MAVSSAHFNDILTNVGDLTNKQTIMLLLQMRSISAGDMPPVDEACACLNALTTDELVVCLRVVKKQYKKDDWDIIKELL